MVIAGDRPRPAAGGRSSSGGAGPTGRRCIPFNLRRRLLNFMMDDEGDARVKATYGENYDRLAAIKGKYDPANLFRVNQNIQPAA